MMAPDYTICVGTIGTGIWLSSDGGEAWGQVREGLWGESRVYGLAVHPQDPHVVYAGTNDGVYRSRDGGKRFEHLDSPMNTMDVWKIASHPANPDVLYAGTRPSALFRSRDGGMNWDQLTVDMVEECPAVRIPRVTSLAVDPGDPDTIWAGVEVDGVRLSTDGGETWSRITNGLDDLDIHDIAIGPSSQVFVSTPKEIFVSADKGASWSGLGVQKHFDFPYCRGLALKADDPAVLFVATGDAAIGSTGAIQRSTDGGDTWEQPPLPVEPNTPIWAFATHAADPSFVVACSHYGQLFRSEDSGRSWQKIKREFGEIRSLAWTPN